MPFSQECWSIQGILGSVASHTSFLDWISTKFEGASDETQANIALLCWAIWKGRNDIVWNNISPSVTGTVSLALTTLQNWRFARQRSFDPSTS